MPVIMMSTGLPTTVYKQIAHVHGTEASVDMQTFKRHVCLISESAIAYKRHSISGRYHMNKQSIGCDFAGT